MSEVQERSMGSVIARRALGVVVVIAAVVGWKLYNKDSASAEARETIATWIHSSPAYVEHPDYLDRLLDIAHEDAFKQSYDVGSRRRAATFDADRYARLMFEGMADRAEADGLSDIAGAILRAEARYRAAPAPARQD